MMQTTKKSDLERALQKMMQTTKSNDLKNAFAKMIHVTRSFDQQVEERQKQQEQNIADAFQKMIRLKRNALDATKRKSKRSSAKSRAESETFPPPSSVTRKPS